MLPMRLQFPDLKTPARCSCQLGSTPCPIHGLEQDPDVSWSARPWRREHRDVLIDAGMKERHRNIVHRQEPGSGLGRRHADDGTDRRQGRGRSVHVVPDVQVELHGHKPASDLRVAVLPPVLVDPSCLDTSPPSLRRGNLAIDLVLRHLVQFSQTANSHQDKVKLLTGTGVVHHAL